MKKNVSLIVPTAGLITFLLLSYGCAIDGTEKNSSAQELAVRPDHSSRPVRSFTLARPGQSEKIDINCGELIILEIQSHKLDNTRMQLKGFLENSQIMHYRFIIGKKMRKYVIKPGIDQLVIRMINNSQVTGNISVVNPNSAKLGKKDIYIKY